MTDAATHKAALVVGAGDYLGAAVARRFAREGYRVAAANLLFEPGRSQLLQ